MPPEIAPMKKDMSAFRSVEDAARTTLDRKGWTVAGSATTEFHEGNLSLVA